MKEEHGYEFTIEIIASKQQRYVLVTTFQELRVEWLDKLSETVIHQKYKNKLNQLH